MEGAWELDGVSGKEGDFLQKEQYMRDPWEQETASLKDWKQMSVADVETERNKEEIRMK